MKKLLLFLIIPFFSFYLMAQSDCSDLFFSEYVEGSHNSKALEIYNPTNQIVDLSKYWIARYSNGSSTYTTGGITQLEGFLPPHDVFVFVNGQTEDNEYSTKCDPELQAMANMLDGAYPAPTYMNGNDAIALLRSDDGIEANAVAVDLIGEIGLGAAIVDETGWSYVQDSTLTYRYDSLNPDLTTEGKVINFIVQDKDITGQNFGPYWMAWTKDHSLIRKPNVRKGVTQNPTPFNVTVEWDTISDEKDVWDSLGTHDCECNTITNVNQIFRETAQVKIYPNPSSDGNIQINSSHVIYSIEVLNLLGQSVYREEYDGVKKLVAMNLGKMEKGIYVLKVSSSDYNYVVKKIWLQ